MSLMLVNPKRRPKKRRSAAQRAATKRMLAARRHRATPVATKRRKSRRHNPISARHVLHRHHARRARRARRHNPIGTGMLSNVAYGAVGAVAVNAAMHYLPLPPSMTTGIMGRASKAALALALGLVGRRFLGSAASKMAEGALIVTAVQAISDFAAPTATSAGIPALTMGEIPSFPLGPRYAYGAISEEHTRFDTTAPGAYGAGTAIGAFHNVGMGTGMGALTNLSAIPEFI